MQFSKKISVLLVATMLIAGCAQPAVGAASATNGAAASATEGPTLDIALDKETPPPQLTKESCLAAGGQIEAFNEPSVLLDAGLRFRIYTPPCYEDNASENYPVIYLIHGQTYNDDQWDRLGADEAADALIADGEVAPFIIVMPADQSHYTQPANNNFDEAVVEELIPWVDAHYRTWPDRAHRAVGGLSRGASWAIHLALTHPELFGSLAGHSPPVFQEDASSVRGWLDALTTETAPRIWLDIGERDQRAIMDSAVWFEGLLDERDIPHEWSLFTGDHSEAYWSSHVELYLRWYAAVW